MSNIFDALRRLQEERPKPTWEPTAVPAEPQTHGQLVKAPEPETQQIRELEGLRERIELELQHNNRRVLSIAASVVGEGASTVGLQLARSMARATESKILLIDADLSRSARTLSTAIDSSDSLAGLVDVLEGGIELSKAILATDEPNLHFLPAGRDATRPLDLLSSESMRRFIEEMSRLYYAVLLDCAPVIEHPEVPALGMLTDGVVLVVHANRTRREVVQRALSALQESRCRVLGIVLNQRRYPIPGFIYRRL